MMSSPIARSPSNDSNYPPTMPELSYLPSPEKVGPDPQFIGGFQDQSYTKEDRKRSKKVSDAMKSIHEDYLNEAGLEDQELVERWTETLNILLTFNGLISALITAFIIAVQPEIEPDPMDTTNRLLLELLQRSDNTTLLSLDSFGQNSTAGAYRILAWWHTSLACSIASGFGALISKQWVMHYQSRPLWANTHERQCRLREARYEGLTRWKFYGILETLLILPQLSILFFAIGLAYYLLRTPSLYIIPCVSIAAIGIFYIITFLAGAFIPSCPFKSPVSEQLLKIVAIAAFWCLTLWPLILETIISSVQYLIHRKISPDRRKKFDAAEDILEYGPRDEAGRELVIKLGEQSLLAIGTTTAAATLSHHQHEVDHNHPPTDGAADPIMSFWINSGAKSFHQRETLRRWCAPVIRRLASGGSSPDSLQEAEDLCHILHHIPQSIPAACLAVMDQLELKIFSSEEAMGHLATILRQSSSQGAGPNELERLLLPSMCGITIAVYLRLQLSHWCSVPPGRRSYIQNLRLELPEILGRKDVESWGFQARIDTIMVAAIALVNEDDSDDLEVEDFIDHQPLEQLFRALRWLSYYPKDAQHIELIPRVIEASSKVLAHEGVSRWPENHTWKNGNLAKSLKRLLQLGHSWADPTGADLLYQVQNIMALLANYGAEVGGRPAPGTPSLFSKGLDDLLALYGRPSPPPTSMSTTTLSQTTEPYLTLAGLDYALGIRKRKYAPDSTTPQYSLNRIPEILHSMEIFSFPRDPQQQLMAPVLRQIIKAIDDSPPDSEVRRLVLSIVVKGRDVFLPASLALRSEADKQLLAALDTISGSMVRKGKYREPLNLEVLGGFSSHWSILLQIFAELERRLSSQRAVAEGLEQDDYVPSFPTLLTQVNRAL